MAGINKVILVGNLGAKPEVKYASNGNAISNLSVATSESWTDKSTGQKQERTEWHRVSLFGKLAEIAGQYLDKGSKCMLKENYRLGNGKIRMVKIVTLQRLSLVVLMELYRCLTVVTILVLVPLPRVKM